MAGEYQEWKKAVEEKHKESWRKYGFGRRAPWRDEVVEWIPLILTACFLTVWILYFFFTYGVRSGLVFLACIGLIVLFCLGCWLLSKLMHK